MKRFSITTIILFAGFCFAAEPVDQKAASKKIDHLVLAGLKKHDMERNDAIDDFTFVRRAYLDIAGRIPTIEESEDFVGSSYERKRERLIADLLESDGHVSHAYNFWADILRVNTALGQGAAQAESAYQLWIKKAIEENRPYDEMVNDLVSATGKIWDNGAVGYYVRDRGMPLDNMSNTVRVFLGVRLECAQCHNHPFDKWTQMDYYKMAAFSHGMDANRNNSENRQYLGQYQRDQRNEAHQAMLVKAGYEDSRFPIIENDRRLKQYTANRRYDRTLERLGMTDREFRKLARKSISVQEEIQEESAAARYAIGRIYQRLRYYAAEEREKTLKLPHDYQYSDAKPFDVVAPATMFGADIDLENIDEGAIAAYADWMTSPENPTFTKVIANRLWKRVFGQGVFEPVDELTDHTYVANPELLSYLEELMRDLDYDMRSYLEILYNTRTYQSGAYTEDVPMGAPYHFPGPVLRRMSAEQIWDSIVALALPEADSYRPRIKTQLKQVEEYRRMYMALEGRSPEEYVEMIEELASGIETYRTRQEEVRKEMYEAREAKDDKKYAELRRELSKLGGEERRKIMDIAFNHVGEKVNPDMLLSAVGMAEMSMSSSQAMSGEAMPKAENAVLTKLPQIKLSRKAPEGLSKNEARAWYAQQKKDYNYYRSLVSKMARASELESPARRGHFLREFGQSDREVIENAASNASVPQALSLLNGPIVEALTNRFAVFGHRLHQAGDPDEKTRMIFQAMLTREPTDREMKLVQAEIAEKGDAAYEGVVWALLNTQQFLFVQ